MSGGETGGNGDSGVMGEDGGGWTLGEVDVAERFKVVLEDVISVAGGEGVEGSIGASEARGDL